MKSPAQIIEILHSIEDVRLNKEEEVEVRFKDRSTTFTDGWEPNRGFIYNSFTQQLLLLIEAALKDELEE